MSGYLNTKNLNHYKLDRLTACHLLFSGVLVLFTFHSFETIGQKNNVYQKRYFQFSIAPGLGTNGIHPGGYINAFSFNLTSGYSAANAFLEIGGISNLNTEYTSGLQIAGVFNLTGGNAFAAMREKEISEKVKSGFEANLQGVQVSGLGNIVLNNVFGGQLTGGFNYSKGALFGLQVAGLANVVEKYGFGVQAAGVYNSVVRSLDGFQVSSLFNFTGGRLQGIQIGAVNRAGLIEGVNSFSYTGYSGLQIGLINYTPKMNGFQIGLVNIGSRQMQGTQIGLINIYRSGKDVNTRDGTSIGLLNIGNTVELLVYTDELFFTNYQITTGTLKNGRKTGATNWIYIQNGLIYGYNPNLIDEDGSEWLIGYSISKKFFNRSTHPTLNQKRFLSGGFEMLHYNQGAKLNDELNLITRIKTSVGTRLRIHPKINSLYLFAGLSYNASFSEDIVDLERGIFTATNTSTLLKQRWAGGHIGLMVH